MITSALKFFLIVRDSAGDVDVWVHETFAEVESFWESFHRQHEAGAGFLHAGSNQPPTSEAVPHLLSGFLVFTDAVRFVAPPGLSENARPHGALMATAYFPAQQLYRVPMTFFSKPLTESVVGFELPDHRVLAAEVAELTSDYATEALAAVLRCLPEHVLGAPIQSLPLTRRCLNAIANNCPLDRGIFVVADLARYRQRDLLKWRSFGKTTLSSLVSCLEGFATAISFQEKQAPVMPDGIDAAPFRGPVGRSFQIGRDCFLPTGTSLLAIFDELVATLRERSGSVVNMRFGRFGIPITLEECGQTLSVTRERVRQMEKEAIARLQQYPWHDEITRRVATLLSERDYPLYLDSLVSEEPWFRGAVECPSFLATVFERLTGGSCRVVDTPHAAIVTMGQFETLSEIQNELSDLFRDAVENHLTPDDIRAIVGAEAASRGCSELAHLLYDELLPELHYGSVDGGLELIAVGRGIVHALSAEVVAAERPLHYSEFATRVSLRLGRTVPPLRVLNDLPKTGALLFGRGVYGSRRHLELDEYELSKVREECETIINRSPPRQWHAEELLRDLAEALPDLSDAVNKYTLAAILEDSASVLSAGRSVWVARQTGSTAARIDIAEAAAWLIERAGAPLTQRVIEDEIVRSRGLAGIFLLQPDERIARVAPGTWGLLARDFLTPELNVEVCERVFSLLESRGSAIHSTEILQLLTPHLALPSWFGGYAALQLAASDGRMKLFRGEFVGLRAWSDARRLTHAGAAAMLARSVSQPLSISELHPLLESLTQRSIARSSVPGLLAHAGFVFDPQSDTWCACGEETATDDDDLPRSEQLQPQNSK